MNRWVRAVAAGVLFVGATLLCSAGPVLAQAAPTLPGGASSLRESHGDWLVACQIVGQATQAHKVCAVSQQQLDNKTHRRVLSIEMQPNGAGADGTLILPFGLALQSGVTLLVGNAPVTATLPFRTCLPIGCVVGITADAKLLASLRTGSSLQVKAAAVEGKETDFTISLKGFAAGYDRIVQLLK